MAARPSGKKHLPQPKPLFAKNSGCSSDPLMERLQFDCRQIAPSAISPEFGAMRLRARVCARLFGSEQAKICWRHKSRENWLPHRELRLFPRREYVVRRIKLTH